MKAHSHSPAATEIEEFNSAHKVWKEASDRFHDRFYAIIGEESERGKKLEALANDLRNKLDHFVAVSSTFIASK
jgi:hypothetical protein